MHEIFDVHVYVRPHRVKQKHLLKMGLLQSSKNPMTLICAFKIHNIEVKFFALSHPYIQFVPYQKLELRRFL